MYVFARVSWQACAYERHGLMLSLIRVETPTMTQFNLFALTAHMDENLHQLAYDVNMIPNGCIASSDLVRQTTHQSIAGTAACFEQA